MRIEPVTAAGGVLFKQDNEKLSVLLIYRRGVWDLPKGKMEGEESIQECAQREIAEEVGCPTPGVAGKLTRTYHEYEEGGKRIGKTTHWYAMQVEQDQGFSPEEEEQITKVAWYPIQQAKQKVEYENLRSVLKALEDFQNEQA